MENEFTNNLNNGYIVERDLTAEIDEAEHEAELKLQELHALLVRYYNQKLEQKATLLALNEYIDKVKEFAIKVDLATVAHKKQELLGTIENISWSVSKALDLVKDIEEELSKITGDNTKQ